jgi:hypothetical protein
LQANKDEKLFGVKIIIWLDNLLVLNLFYIAACQRWTAILHQFSAKFHSLSISYSLIKQHFTLALAK